MRQNYTQGTLLEQDAPAQPHLLFTQWLSQAIEQGVEEPNAMTLATVGNDARPSLRVVLLKGHDERGLVWFTNYQSRKGIELAGNPQAALQFFWMPMQRMVRVEGCVEKISDEENDRYFHSRPLPSRIGAWASAQSQPVANRAVLDDAYARVEAGLAPGQGPERPSHWGGYRLVPTYWEFWQGRIGRLHDRLSYSRHPQDWKITRLAP